MSAPPLDAKTTIRLPSELLEQAKRCCQEEGVSLSFVLRTALQDFVRYGLEVRIRRQPPDTEEEAGGFF